MTEQAKINISMFVFDMMDSSRKGMEDHTDAGNQNYRTLQACRCVYDRSLCPHRFHTDRGLILKYRSALTVLQVSAPVPHEGLAASPVMSV